MERRIAVIYRLLAYPGILHALEYGIRYPTYKLIYVLAIAVWIQLYRSVFRLVKRKRSFRLTAASKRDGRIPDRSFLVYRVFDPSLRRISVA